MTDRGKIVRGMECCVNGEHSECPYRDRDNDNGMLKCWSELMRDALELLKEQKPVKPKQMGTVTHWYACGACQMPVDYEDAYCRGCGRGLKWDANV